MIRPVTVIATAFESEGQAWMSLDGGDRLAEVAVDALHAAGFAIVRQADARKAADFAAFGARSRSALPNQRAGLKAALARLREAAGQ